MGGDLDEACSLREVERGIANFGKEDGIYLII